MPSRFLVSITYLLITCFYTFRKETKVLGIEEVDIIIIFQMEQIFLVFKKSFSRLINEKERFTKVKCF